MQCGANALLVRVYVRTGRREEAVKIANALPSFEVGRELMIAECLSNSEKSEYYAHLIDRLEGKIELLKKRIAEK